MRALYCGTCGTLEEIPDLDHDLHEGEEDPFVSALVMRHTERDPMGHGAVDKTFSPFRLPSFDDNEWVTHKPELIAQLNQNNKDVGFDQWVYDSRNTFVEDALRCYVEHHRPKEGCIDYWDDSKRLGRPTPEGQSVLRENYKLGRGDPHLCQFCPVHTFVATQVRWRQGAYKEN
jgi:hypothetical protein